MEITGTCCSCDDFIKWIWKITKVRPFLRVQDWNSPLEASNTETDNKKLLLNLMWLMAIYNLHGLFLIAQLNS